MKRRGPSKGPERNFVSGLGRTRTPSTLEACSSTGQLIRTLAPTVLVDHAPTRQEGGGRSCNVGAGCCSWWMAAP